MNFDSLVNRAITHNNYVGYLPQSLIPKNVEKNLNSIATLDPLELARYYHPDKYVMGYADPAFSGGEYTRGLSFHDYKAREELYKFKHDDLPLFMYSTGQCFAEADTCYSDSCYANNALQSDKCKEYSCKKTTCLAAHINDPHSGDNNYNNVFEEITDSEPAPMPNFIQTDNRDNLLNLQANSLNASNYNLSNIYGAVPLQDIPLYPQISNIETKNPKTSLSPELLEHFRNTRFPKNKAFNNNQSEQFTVSKNLFETTIKAKPSEIKQILGNNASYILDNNDYEMPNINNPSDNINLNKKIIPNKSAKQILSNVIKNQTKEAYNINEEFNNILPFLSEQYLNALKTRAVAVCYFLQTNPAYQHYAKNWEFLKSNLDKSGLLFKMLSSSDNDIAYVINKGDNVNFRILDNSRYVPINIYQYVLYHEMAHMSTQELQHTDKFKELLAVISLAGFELGFIDLNKIPTMYYNSNGQPILNKDSMKAEITDGCTWLMQNSNQPEYYEKLMQYIQSK